MKVIFDKSQSLHYPKHFLSSGAQTANPEQPERADRLFMGALAAGLDPVEPDDHGLFPIAAVHTPEYIQFLQHIYARWLHIPEASAEVIPNIHPERRDFAYPASAVGQAGYHMADTACPISEQTWTSAYASANTAVHAAKLVLAGDRAAYGLSRPPGHHATADMAGGFCYLNNSAIAAQTLRSVFERVAIIDVDLHHGNGTQSIFYRRSDVMTISIHADPERFYPFFWGHKDERGEGEGLGYNLNLPLPRGSRDDIFLEALGSAITRLGSFAPDAIVIALGLDASEADPFGGLAISTDGFAKIGQHLGALALPTAIIQEGGYLCDELENNLTSFLNGFSNS